MSAAAAAAAAPEAARAALEAPAAALSVRERARQLVRRVPLLAQAVRAAACSHEALLDALAPREFAAHEYIYAQGQTGARELFFLERGRVQLTRRARGAAARLPAAGKRRSPEAAAAETQVDALEPFEYFGELSLLCDAAARATSAVALPAETLAPPASASAPAPASAPPAAQGGDAEPDASALASDAACDAAPAVACLVLSEAAFAALLAPLHALMRARGELRAHRVLDHERLFRAWRWPQKRFVLERSALARFPRGARLCEQRDTHDDRFFIVLEGEAHVVVADDREPGESADGESADGEPADGEPPAAPGTATTLQGETVVARKSRFQSFGEMALLGFPRVASVVAVGGEDAGAGGGGGGGRGGGSDLVCLVITRAVYAAAKSLGADASGSAAAAASLRADAPDADASSALADASSAHAAHADGEAEAALAAALADEWALAANARKLRLSNPRVARHLVTFIQRFKAAYQQLFEGKSAYLDLLRRLRDEPELARGAAGDLAALAERLAGPDAAAAAAAAAATAVPITAASLGVVRAEVRRVLSLPPAARAPSDVALVARLMERSALVAKIERPAGASALQVARALAQVVTFVRAGKQRPLVRQGRVESRAFLVLRGKVLIVNERGGGSGGAGAGGEVLATLQAGDSFGELSLVARQRRSASALTPSSADLIALDREHLAHLQRQVPGVAVQRLMVERATFLARLSFLRPAPAASAFEAERAQDEALAECIRVAYDVLERAYGPRHRFFCGDADADGDRRALLVVKAGEVGVFMRKQLPVLAAPPASSLAPAPAPVSPASSPAAAGARSVLVRVATIGPMELFGSAIAALIGSTAAVAAAAAADDERAAELLEADTVYVSCSHVQVVELPERAWRRLRPASIAGVRRSLLERYRWNARAAIGQRFFYHAERPWQLVGTSAGGVAAGDDAHAPHAVGMRVASAATATAAAAVTATASATGKSHEAIEPVATTSLARRIHDKRRHTGQAGAFVSLFGRVRDAESTGPRWSNKPAPSSTDLCSTLPVLPVLPLVCAPRASGATATSAVGQNPSPPTSVAAWESDWCARQPPSSPSPLPPSSALGGSFSPSLALQTHSSGTGRSDRATTSEPPTRCVAAIAPPPGSAAARSSPRAANGRRLQQQPALAEQGAVPTATMGASPVDAFHGMWKLDRRTSLG